MFERYSLVAITTLDLDRARRFWVDALGFRVTEEEACRFFIVDAGGLRLCIDVADDDIHTPGSTDPVNRPQDQISSRSPRGACSPWY